MDLRRRRWLPLVAVSFGFFMVILDVTVVTVAVPSLGSDLRAGASALQWVVDGYTLAFAALMLLCGRLGDRFGHRRTFVAGLVVFTAASAACGAAPTAGLLIAARLVQGIGAALMVPASLALLRAAYPEPEARARAFGAWAALSGLGAAAGPLVGGLAVRFLDWRAAFGINLPFGLLAIVLTVRSVPAPAPRAGTSLRLPAQLLGIASLAALTAGLNEAGALGWSDPLVTGCLGAGIAAGLGCAALVRWPAPRQPRLPSHRARGLAGGTMVGLLLNLGIYGLIYLATLYFQRLRGYSPLEAGLGLLPLFAVMTASSFLSGRLCAHTGPRVPMVAGLLAGSAGLAGWVLAGPHSPYASLVIPMALAGGGTAFTMPAATTAVMESAPTERGGTAAATLNTARQIGSALGVALFGSLAASRFIPGLHLSALLAAGAFLLAALTAALTAPGATTTRAGDTATSGGRPGRTAAR
ncbi:MFS transporter [Streptomyces sp. RB6PN25]|uniref:MFS transporter n=1 Tax=Streptomyces humicola TaxID=2953240 RepID=A0ABT1PTQ4_9ACTN|nr:MFS transporter [Streptomyces humicola]MCQ4079925.1 MFS transporter [Streptomyces humicola]